MKRVFWAALLAAFFCAPANAAAGFTETFDAPSGLPPAYQIWGVTVTEDIGPPMGNVAVTSQISIAEYSPVYLYYSLQSFDIMPVGDDDLDLYLRLGYDHGGPNYFTTIHAGEWTHLAVNLALPYNDPLVVLSSPGIAAPGSSPFYIDNIRVFATYVPEPSTWATMLLGFCMIGLGLRRGKRDMFSAESGARI